MGLRRGVANDELINVVHDLALMHSLGVRLVVVHEQNTFNSEPLTPMAVNQAVLIPWQSAPILSRCFRWGYPTHPFTMRDSG